jgi:predicted MFS family arabinose efflux permease
MARFGYSPLIPELVRERWFTAVNADYLAAINLAGYVIGSLTAAQLLARRAPGPWVRISLVVGAASFWACARPWGFGWFLIWRLLAGIAAGLLMVLGIPEVLRRTPAARRGVVGGLAFAGVGSGVVVAGVLVPWLANRGLTFTWLGLGALCFIVTAAAWGYWHPSAAGVQRAAAGTVHTRPPVSRGLALLALAYMLCAVGYVPHSIFWVDYIARELGRGLAAGGHAYMELGLGAVAGPAVAGVLGDWLGVHRCLGWLLLLDAAAVALPLAGSTVALMTVSSLGVGATQMGATALMSARSGELARPEHRTQTWGWLTISFSIAYAAGGGGMSALFARIGSYYPLFAMAAALLAASALLVALARPSAG